MICWEAASDSGVSLLQGTKARAGGGAGCDDAISGNSGLARTGGVMLHI